MPKCPLVIVLSVGTFFSEISPDEMLLLADLFLICMRYHRGTYSICCYPYQHKPHIYKTQIKLCKRYASHLLWQCRELKPSHPRVTHGEGVSNDDEEQIRRTSRTGIVASVTSRSPTTEARKEKKISTAIISAWGIEP